MTDTTPTATEEEPKEPTLNDLIADATDRFVDDLNDVAAEWAKANDRKCGPLPSTLRSAVHSQTVRALGTAFYVPAYRAELEPNPIKPGLAR